MTEIIIHLLNNLLHLYFLEKRVCRCLVAQSMPLTKHSVPLNNLSVKGHK